MQSTRGIALQYMFYFAASCDVYLGKDILQCLSQIDWSQQTNEYFLDEGYVEEFIAKVYYELRLLGLLVNKNYQIPQAWRSKIIRPFRGRLLDVIRQTVLSIKRGEFYIGYQGVKAYIIGNGDNEASLVKDGHHYILRSYSKST